MKIREQYGLKGSAGATHREDDRYGGQVQDGTTLDWWAPEGMEVQMQLVSSELIFPSGFLP